MLKNLSLKVKLITLFLIVGLIPLLVGVVISYKSASTALEHETMNQLISVRELKKTRIEEYFKTIEHQALSFSENLMVMDAHIQGRSATEAEATSSGVL